MKPEWIFCFPHFDFFRVFVVPVAVGVDVDVDVVFVSR